MNLTACFETINTSKRFGATDALRNVNLRINSGEVTAIVGENGSGKSTLMEIAAGTHQLDSGEMRLFGIQYSPKSPFEARKSGVVMVHQDLSLIPHMTVSENLFLGEEPNSWGLINNKESEALSDRILSIFDNTRISKNITVDKLPSATQQLIEIARAVRKSVRVLILDEPTSGLSKEDVDRLFVVIRQLKEQGIAIVYITHFLEEVKEISDQIIVLRDGEVVGTGQTADLSVDQIISLMVGRPLKKLYHRTPRVPGEILLDVSELKGEKKPISASFSLRRGEVIGIAGLRDSGRTELLRCLFGLAPVKSGMIKLCGISGPITPKRSWNLGVGMIPEDRLLEGLAPTLGIHDNITLTRLGQNRFGFFSQKRQINTTRSWMDHLGIRSSEPNAPVSTLSGGNQQKVIFGRLLNHDVDVFLLDEPTKGIDIGAKEMIYNLIDVLASGTDGRPPKAILIVSSYLPELFAICDRIAVMSQGCLGFAHNVSDVDQHSLMSEALGDLY